jgi:hypothetical protein
MQPKNNEILELVYQTKWLKQEYTITPNTDKKDGAVSY